ncbi:MAG: hypothetical protein ACOYNL_01575 [Rickettsiales bacterium]
MKLLNQSALIALTLLSACVVEEPYNQPYNRSGYYAPRDTGYYAPRNVVVHVDDRDNWDDYDRDWDHDDHDHGKWDNPSKGYYCPPGQAKKGNC